MRGPGGLPFNQSSGPGFQENAKPAEKKPNAKADKELVFARTFLLVETCAQFLPFESGVRGQGHLLQPVNPQAFLFGSFW